MLFGFHFESSTTAHPIAGTAHAKNLGSLSEKSQLSLIAKIFKDIKNGRN